LAAPDKRILVIEDNSSVRDALAAVLTMEGYAVSTAGDGLEGLALLPGEPPYSLVLLDLMMPVMDGFAFLAERARRPTVAAIPVIITSAFEARPPGGTPLQLPYLRKPVDVEQLLALMREHGG
jgi:CheY-like chemotaxis protein